MVWRLVVGEADVVASGEVPGWTEHGSGRVVGGTTVLVDGDGDVGDAGCSGDVEGNSVSH